MASKINLYIKINDGRLFISATCEWKIRVGFMHKKNIEIQIRLKMLWSDLVQFNNLLPLIERNTIMGEKQRNKNKYLHVILYMYSLRNPCWIFCVFLGSCAFQ